MQREPSPTCLPPSLVKMQGSSIRTSRITSRKAIMPWDGQFLRVYLPNLHSPPGSNWCAGQVGRPFHSWGSRGLEAQISRMYSFQMDVDRFSEEYIPVRLWLPSKQFPRGRTV